MAGAAGARGGRLQRSTTKGEPASGRSLRGLGQLPSTAEHGWPSSTDTSMWRARSSYLVSGVVLCRRIDGTPERYVRTTSSCRCGAIRPGGRVPRDTRRPGRAGGRRRQGSTSQQVPRRTCTNECSSRDVASRPTAPSPAGRHCDGAAHGSSRACSHGRGAARTAGDGRVRPRPDARVRSRRPSWRLDVRESWEAGGDGVLVAVFDELRRHSDLRQAVVDVEMAIAAQLMGIDESRDYGPGGSWTGVGLAREAAAIAGWAAVITPEVRMALAWMWDAGCPDLCAMPRSRPAGSADRHRGPLDPVRGRPRGTRRADHRMANDTVPSRTRAGSSQPRARVFRGRRRRPQDRDLTVKRMLNARDRSRSGLRPRTVDDAPFSPVPAGRRTTPGEGPTGIAPLN